MPIAAALTLLLALPVEPRDLTVAQWRKDLEFLARSLPEIHCDLDRLLSRAELEAEVERISRAIPRRGRPGIIFELARLVARLGDGHSSLSPAQEAAGFRRLPLFVYAFADGLHILDAQAPYEDLVGTRLVSIGGMPMDRVYARLEPAISGENEGFRRLRFNRLVLLAELLEATRVIPRADRVTLTVAHRDGDEETIEMTPVSREAWTKWIQSRSRVIWKPEDLGEEKPFYWFDLRPQTGTLYLYYNTCRDHPDEKMADFVKRLERFVNRNDFERFVLDLRSNGGGSANISVPLVRLPGATLRSG